MSKGPQRVVSAVLGKLKARQASGSVIGSQKGEWSGQIESVDDIMLLPSLPMTDRHRTVSSGASPQPSALLGRAGHCNADKFDCSPWSGLRARLIAGMPHSASVRWRMVGVSVHGPVIRLIASPISVST